MSSTTPTHTTSPKSQRLKPTAAGAVATVVETAEVAVVKKQKKPQKPLIRQSPRKVSSKERRKEKMDKGKENQPMESIDLEEEQLETGVEDISVDEAEPILTVTSMYAAKKPDY